MRKEMFIAFVLYEYQGAQDATFFSSAYLWAGPSIRSPVRSRPECQPAPGLRRKPLSLTKPVARCQKKKNPRRGDRWIPESLESSAFPILNFNSMPNMQASPRVAFGMSIVNFRLGRSFELLTERSRKASDRFCESSAGMLLPLYRSTLLGSAVVT